MSQIYLVRHGQASFSMSDYDQLSELGFEQSRVLGQSFKSRLNDLHRVYRGAMRRHQETTDTCLQSYGSSLTPTVLAGFNEYDHDEVIVRAEPRYADRLAMMADLAATAHPKRAFQEFFKGAVARWVSGEHDADYAESWPAFKARCVQALLQVQAELGANETALVFTSGGPITAVCQHLLKLSDEHAFELNWVAINAGLSKILHTERGTNLLSFNDHAHFEGANKHLITYR